jgi:putative membrane-bound dehydrogenase-like protein
VSPLRMQLNSAAIRVSIVIVAMATPVFGAGLPPDETVKGMKPAEGLEVKLAAAEPMVRQPVNVSFDERGRMWVVQYLQYPDPAGLKPVSVDQYLRTKYDRVPDPPPRGPVGKDKITILEDTDGDGVYDKSKDFVTGLNLASSVEVGHGGVWVAQTPYLLFYPDADRDDVPDGEPKVVLSGFGMEDAHAVVNHLTWGPDGWLYGAQGSTCTANVRGHTFQQAAWRYHPATDRFEVFSEGGGNTFGLEWDAHGNLLTGTNYANYVMVHYVQGGYFIKGFAKHGPLSNPYSFGYFDHVPHEGWRGGHVTQLGVVYQGGALPDQYNGKWIAPNLLANNVDFHEMRVTGSTFRTKLLGSFLESADKAFRPVDIRTGPDGAVYVADWYDARANHVIPQDTWDKKTGRVYRIGPKNLPGVKPFDLAKRSSEELVALLSHRNDWYARTAQRLLAERRDAAVVPKLLAMVREGKDRAALQALWALHASGGFNEGVASELLEHPTADVRSWTVRLLGDAKSVSPSTAARLAQIAAAEPAAEVRAQLACTARRLPADQGLPIVAELMKHSADADDRYIPLLLWWAIEGKATSDRGAVANLFAERSVWQTPLARRHLIERLARRYTAEPTDENLEAAARLLQYARQEREQAAVRANWAIVIAGMNKGLAGKVLDTPPQVLAADVERVWRSSEQTVPLTSIALRLGHPDALERGREAILSSETPPADRAALIETWGDAGPEAAPLLRCLDPEEPKEVRAAALTALQRFTGADIGAEVLKRYPELPQDLRSRAVTLLTSRAGWAAELLAAVEGGVVGKQDIPLEQVRRFALHNDPKLDAAVAKLFGTARRDTPEEKKRAVENFKQVLAGGAGDAATGKTVYATACGQCHALHGEGNRVGPDLTGYDRRDLDFLLSSIVDPSAAIRPEFAAYVVQTTDGRVLNGPIVASGPETVTVEDGQARITVGRGLIKRLAESPVSRMPEGLLDALTPQQVRDLFAYLATEGPQAVRE